MSSGTRPTAVKKKMKVNFNFDFNLIAIQKLYHISDVDNNDDEQ